MTAVRHLVILLMAASLLAACSDADLTREARPTTLANTSWQVVAINGVATAPDARPTAVFKIADVTGSAGCNSYGGGYRYDPATGALAFDQLGQTAMLCAEPAKNAVETAFTKALLQVSAASMDPAGRLVLTGPAGEIVLEVAAVPR